MYTLNVNMQRKWIHDCDCPAFQPWHQLCKHVYTFLRSYPDFFYRDLNWDNMLPEDVVARQLLPDGQMGQIQRPIRPLPGALGPGDNRPRPNGDNNAAGGGPQHGRNVDGQMADYEAMRQARIDAALEAMRRQQRHHHIVKLMLEEERVLGQVLPDGNAPNRRRFTPEQLEEIAASYDANRRLLTAIANGDD
jgi:hypothetical protein